MPGRVKFLLLEDHEGVREVVEMMLQCDGHEVVSFADGSAALDYLAAQTVDFILMDWNTPGASGARFLKSAQDRLLPLFYPKIAVISGDPEVALEARSLGADFFLAKPFTPDRLVRSLGIEPLPISSVA